MSYISTLHNSPPATLKEVILHSVAPDGGIYMPSQLPRVPDAFIRNMVEMNFKEIAYAVSKSLLGDDVEAQLLKDAVDEAFSFDMPLVEVTPGLMALELFHGPTQSYKDISARFMSYVCTAILNRNTTGLRLNVLLATNGSTAEAVADAVACVPESNVFVLYPKTSRRYMAKHLKATAGNVRPIEVQGTIEDCKEIVHKALSDNQLRDKMHLVTGNAINIMRLIPQVAIFFQLVSRLMARDIDPRNCPVAITVENLTTLTAAVLAGKMGLPLGPIIAASHSGGFFHSYMQQGEAEARYTDTGTPTNLPRLLHLYDNDFDAMHRDLRTVCVTDEEIRHCIDTIHDESGYELSPHSAIACEVLLKCYGSNATGVFPATVHPSKWKALDEPGSSLHSSKIPPTYPAFRKFLLSQNDK